MLRHCIPASIRKTLDQLPKSLDDTYLRVLRQIPQANQAHAHRMLQCLVVAVRPLKVAELAELLAFEFDGAQGGIPKYCPALRLDDQTQAVLSTCSSLVTIVNERRPDRQVVQFSHFSVKEFLVSNRLAPSLGDISQYNIRLRSAHITLTEACLGLLLHSDDSITEKTVECSPLAGYAARHWVEHAQFEDVASCVKDGMETLFDADKPHFEAWVGIYNIDPRVSWQHISVHPSLLYYSVLCGFYDLVEHLAITHPEHVNAVGGEYQFPLLAVLGEGHIEIVELLLKHGADIDIREAMGKTMLLMAITWLEDNDILLDTVEFLLTHGVDVNAQDDTFTSSLHLAGGYSFTWPVVTILLKHGADVNSQDNNCKTPLHRLLEAEIYDGKDEDDSNQVRLLLEHGAEVNRRDKEHQTPLLLAMKRSWFKTARILVEHGADANTANRGGKTLLHILFSDNGIDDEDVVLEHALFLLKHGAEVNKRDKCNNTLLHLAIRYYLFKPELAVILLVHGADANAENNQGMTALHILSSNHNICYDEDDLLDHGADVNAENNQGMTPLHILSESDIDDKNDAHYVLNNAMLLLQHGAEVNRQDKDKETPLHLAIRWGWFKLAGILLEYGADANVENNQGMTPLHILSESGTKYEGNVLDLALLLLKHDAEVNRRDKDKHQEKAHLLAKINY